MGMEYSLGYILAFALGGVFLLVFSLEKFDKPYPGNRYLVELLPSNLSPATSYVKAFLVYFTILLGFYAVVCFFFSTATGVFDVIFGEGVAKVLKPDGTNQAPPAAPEIPLVFALLMVGLFPKYKQFGEIEAPLRRFSHSLIGVPHGLEKLSAEIAATPIQGDSGDRAAVIKIFLGHRLSEMPAWARNRLAEHLQLNELRTESSEDDSDEEIEEKRDQTWRSLLSERNHSIQVAEKWHRAKSLVNQIFQQKSFDAEAREKYEKLRTDLKTTYGEMESEIAEIDNAQSKLTELVETLRKVKEAQNRARQKRLGAMTAEDLSKMIDSLEALMNKQVADFIAAEARIESILGKSHLCIAASIILQSSKADRNTILETYGLKSPDPVWPPIDGVLLAVILMAGALFVINFLIYEGLYLFSFGDSNPSLTALRLVGSALTIHGGAAIAAAIWWRPPEDAANEPSPVSVRRFMWLGAAVYIGVFLGLVLWAFTLITLSPKTPNGPAIFSVLLNNLLSGNLAIAQAVLSLSAIVTAVFTVLNVEFAARYEPDYKRIIVRAVIQGALTAFIVLVSSLIQAPSDMYLAVTSSVNGLVVGLSLAAGVLKFTSKRK
jgi:hypothetical protein